MFVLLVGVESIDLGAPWNRFICRVVQEDGFTSGTSFASPCVAGACSISVPCPNLVELATFSTRHGRGYP